LAHRISMTEDGKAELAWAGHMPWHSLGTQVDGLLTADGILQAAGLTWEVETRPVSYPVLQTIDGSDVYVASQVPDVRAIVRNDTQAVLGVVSDRYACVQNSQNAQIVDGLVAEGGAHCEVAGALDGGKRCWILTRLPESFEVVKGDEVNPYFLLAWGHDGRHGIGGKLTPIRVVCANTLAAAGFGGGRWSKVADVYIKHVKSATIRIDEARAALGLVRKQTQETVEAYRQLAGITVGDKEFVAYAERLFPAPFAAPTATGDLAARIEAQIERWESQRAELFGCWAQGKGTDIPGVKGTAWGAYNAVTEYLDHVYPYLANGRRSEVREQSVIFGTYSALKDRALASALSLA
jgi:phage/plasmid-like protein (TIGR03299 family)